MLPPHFLQKLSSPDKFLVTPLILKIITSFHAFLIGTYFERLQCCVFAWWFVEENSHINLLWRTDRLINFNFDAIVHCQRSGQLDKAFTRWFHLKSIERNIDAMILRSEIVRKHCILAKSQNDKVEMTFSVYSVYWSQFGLWEEENKLHLRAVNQPCSNERWYQFKSNKISELYLWRLGRFGICWRGRRKSAERSSPLFRNLIFNNKNWILCHKK